MSASQTTGVEQKVKPATGKATRIGSIASLLLQLAQQEDLNFLVTNRIPRRMVTRFMGWFSKIEQPMVRDLSLAVWQLFADLELEDSARSEFRSMHDCFTRELKPGARPLAMDPHVVVSPCDGIVGGSGKIDGVDLIQAKGMGYTLRDLLGDQELVDRYRNGRYVTLRLTSSMYHRFHAPHDLTVEHVQYLSGDTYNTNPIALKRVEKLFCKNERAILRTRLERSGHQIVLVPVAAILVASIRLHFLDTMFHLAYNGPAVVRSSARFKKGDEMGWYEHGSTILVFAPDGVELCEDVTPGARVRMGEPLLSLPK
jgi:phosphatidylserine decarboxylase